ncbi:MAG: hypothetical protein A2W99_12440 [Bacteroidetes bacterium GWF2_33_16]|nr:MAG: hypothetical protein A2X00_01835 [Bacteroidetes bacterium GWE2_32_14]OFY06501.1 MAG: hypothetical protein A2W99_12440 [Bacteroidetes bacterium GWF2_33_16]
MTKQTDNNLICCPEFKPELWDDKILEWHNKKFIKDSVFTIFFMPVNFGAVMRRIDNKVRKADASTPDFLCLADHVSRWKMDVYLAVDKDIPNANNIVLSGKFFSKVYEGPFKDTGKWCKDFENEAKLKGFTVNKWFMWYTTCPKCAKKYGKNYVAIISQVE